MKLQHNLRIRAPQSARQAFHHQVVRGITLKRDTKDIALGLKRDLLPPAPDLLILFGLTGGSVKAGGKK